MRCAAIGIVVLGAGTFARAVDAPATRAGWHWEARPGAPAYVVEFVRSLPALKAQTVAAIDAGIARAKCDRAAVIREPDCPTDVTGTRTMTGGTITRTDGSGEVRQRNAIHDYDQQIIALYALEKRILADGLWLPDRPPPGCGAGAKPAGLPVAPTPQSMLVAVANPEVPPGQNPAALPALDVGQAVEADISATPDRRAVARVHNGDSVRVVATGVWCGNVHQRSSTTYASGGHLNPATGLPTGYLQAHLGDGTTLRVDGELHFRAPADGTLSFDMADDDRSDNDGSMHVVVSVEPG